MGHPLQDWKAFDAYRPPDPRDPFCYENATPLLADVGDKYVVMTRALNLIERHCSLRDFENAMMDFWLEPRRTHRLLDMITEYRLVEFDEMKRRFADRVHAVLLTDDWGTQQGTFTQPRLYGIEEIGK